MIKKSLTMIASGLLIANVASATELYDQNGTTFSVGGYLKIGYQSTAKDVKGNLGKVNGKYNNSRINFAGTNEINDNFTAFGKTEWKIDPTVQKGDGKNLLTSRLAFVGIEHKLAGKLSFGKQWSSYYNVASFTDLYEITGSDALGIYEDGDAGSFHGTGRANSALKYDIKVHGTGISVQYQAQDVNTDKIERKYAFGGSIVQEIGSNLKVGIAGNYAKLKDLTGKYEAKMDRASGVVGISFDNDMLVLALTGSYNTNIYSAGETKSHSIGQESFIGVRVVQPVLIYIGNNLSTTSYKKDEDKRTIDYNYLALGSKYDLTSEFSVSGEFRYDLRSKKQIINAYTEEKLSMNLFTLAVKYQF